MSFLKLFPESRHFQKLLPQKRHFQKLLILKRHFRKLYLNVFKFLLKMIPESFVITSKQVQSEPALGVSLSWKSVAS